MSGTVYLTYPAVTSVTNANVTVAGNPPAPGIQYFTRYQLAVIAKGIHDGSLVNAGITFTRSGNTYTFDVKDLYCPEKPCTAAWDFGDGVTGSGAPVSHDYGTAFGSYGNFPVVLTVMDALGAKATAGLSLTVYPASAHPYANGTDTTWTFTQPGNPSSIDVTFDPRTIVESGYDTIYVMDKNGTNIAGSPFTGTTLAGTTKTVSGDTVKIRLTSDGSVTAWGFEVSKVVSTGSTQQQVTKPMLRSHPVTKAHGRSGD